jgi:hypothetical protein
MVDTHPKRPGAAQRGDARGTPRGAGTVAPAHGGLIGNPRFVPTDEQRLKVRTLAKTFPTHSQHLIAVLLGISDDTLTRHFKDDLELGRAEMLAAIGSQMIQRAIDAETIDGKGQKVAKGDLDAQKFILARLGGWTTKVEMTGKGGGPIEYSNMTEEEIDRRIAELTGKYAGPGEGEEDDARDD